MPLPSRTPWKRFGFRVWNNRVPGVMPSPHLHTEVEINFVKSGSLVYFHAGKFYQLQKDQFGIFWAGLPHQIKRLNENPNGVWATVPLSWLISWNVPEKFRNALLQGVFFIGDISSFRINVDKWAEDFESKNHVLSKVVELELQAFLLRCSQEAATSKKTHSPHQGTRSHVENITNHIAQNYQETMRVDDIARAVKLHPKYIIQLFKKECGFSLSNYISRFRVSHAQRLLIQTDLKIAEIALESGFESTATFYRVFKSQSKISPVKYRENYSSSR